VSIGRVDPALLIAWIMTRAAPGDRGADRPLDRQVGPVGCCPVLAMLGAVFTRPCREVCRPHLRIIPEATSSPAWSLLPRHGAVHRRRRQRLRGHTVITAGSAPRFVFALGGDPSSPVRSP